MDPIALGNETSALYTQLTQGGGFDPVSTRQTIAQVTRTIGTSQPTYYLAGEKVYHGNPVLIRDMAEAFRKLSANYIIGNLDGLALATMDAQKYYTVGQNVRSIVNNMGPAGYTAAGGGVAGIAACWNSLLAFMSLDFGAIAAGGSGAVATASGIGVVGGTASFIGGAGVGYVVNESIVSIQSKLVGFSYRDVYFPESVASLAHEYLPEWAGF